MTAVAPSTRRPVKPRRSPLIYAAIAVFMAITLAAVSEQWGIGLDLFAILEDLGNGRVVLEQLLSPNWAFLPRVIDPLIETFQMAVVAAFFGCGIALPISFLASRTTVPNRTTLTISRGILSVVRAIPDFLYALIFVAAVGIGPLPGIMALIFFNVGVVAKLLSETVDAVDSGPIEAVDAGGRGNDGFAHGHGFCIGGGNDHAVLGRDHAGHLDTFDRPVDHLHRADPAGPGLAQRRMPAEMRDGDSHALGGFQYGFALGHFNGDIINDQFRHL